MYNSILIGNLTKAPQRYADKNSNSIAKFTVACNDRDEVIFVNCVAFGKTAEACLNYLNKGSKVYVYGKNQERQWEKDGVQYKNMEIIVEKIEFLSKAEKNVDENETKFDEETRHTPTIIDDDLPF